MERGRVCVRAFGERESVCVCVIGVCVCVCVSGDMYRERQNV